MIDKQKRGGLIPVMVTPLDSRGRPDAQGIERLVEFHAGAGVCGLWVLGSAGEDIHLSFRDRVLTARHTIEASRGRLELFVGLGPSSYYEIMDFCDQIEHEKVRGVHLLPYDVKMGESQFIDYCAKLADEAACPLWLYHNPKRGRLFTQKVLEELKDHPNIHGMKVGGYNLTEITAAMKLRSERFEVFGAGGGQLFQLLCLGAESHTASDSCCYPEPFLEVFEEFRSGRLEQARRLQFRLIDLARKLPRTQNGEYAAEEKYILSKRGICDEHVVPAYRTLTTEEKGRVDQALREFGFEWA